MKKNLIPESLLPLLELAFQAGQLRDHNPHKPLFPQLSDWLGFDPKIPDEMDLEQVATDLLSIKIKDINPNVCPCCGSDNIHSNEWEPEAGYQKVECEDCGADWQEQYTFTGIGEINDPNTPST